MATNIQQRTAVAAEAHHLPAIHMAREVAHLSTPAPPAEATPRATSQGRRHGSEAPRPRRRHLDPRRHLHQYHAAAPVSTSGGGREGRAGEGAASAAFRVPPEPPLRGDAGA